MIKSTSISILLLVLGMFSTQAQSSFTEGIVKLELTDISSENAETEAALGMLKGMTMETSFNKTHSLTVIDMMGGMMNTKVLINNASKEKVLMFDMMGQKTMTKSKLEDNDGADKVAEGAEKVKTISFKDDTKTIAGYKCYRIEIDIDPKQKMSMVAYITEEIQASTKGLQGFENLDVDGFPLEFKLVMGDMMSMTYTAVEVVKELDASVFDLDYKGYKEMSMEEFLESAGGMGGGMGF